MRGSFYIVVLGAFLMTSLACKEASADFASKQQNAARVKQARAKWTPQLKEEFKKANIAYPAKAVMVRVFKDDDLVELWASNGGQEKYALVKTFPVCARSGTLGPKRQQGDLQVPEGIYHVDRFNAWSSYHLSLGLNYPNASDRALGKKPLGGDIFVHGDCVTIGCVPIQDEPIEQLYVALVDAKVAHRIRVRVEVYPFRMSEERLSSTVESPHHAFWKMLQPAY